MAKQRSRIAAWVGGVALIASASSHSAEIEPGTILNAANLDQLSAQTLDGKVLGDLLTPSQVRMIREHGMQMRLRHTGEIKTDERLIEATQRYAGQASVNPETKVLEGHVSGMPFADIDASNPADGIKVAYNFSRGSWYADAVDYNPMVFAIIDGEKGLEREQRWRFARLLTAGRTAEPHKLEDDVVKYEVVLNKYPEDTRGTGVVTVSYDDARLPDVYAYIKAVRRVRRLSSRAWADPLSATDLLNDEAFGMAVDPAWYADWKLVGKRWIMASAHSTIEVAPEADSAEARFPMIDLDNAPYWNILDDWEPREVFVVEATPPKGHLLSKKVQYYDADIYSPMIHWQEFYDRKGDLWRIENCNYRPTLRQDGTWSQTVTYVPVIDLQRLHASIVFAAPEAESFLNDASLEVKDFQPHAIPRLIK
ncbi:MAG: DUF1329 domain-containing protein [Immundisolibacteraceae bacterium]|nr:DUF1329 domain-containing protein [Immundisolibacteraceae bacterium]